jgi:hypothetical protein
MMRLSALDRSKYYRGLLVLVRRDRVVHRRERDLMLRIGKLLDFDQRFCAAALDDLLRNRQITDEPVVFSRREVAECFLTDAAALASCDDDIHPHELACLRSIARANGLTKEWLDARLQRHVGKKRASHERPSFPAVRQLL